MLKRNIIHWCFNKGAILIDMIIRPSKWTSLSVAAIAALPCSIYYCRQYEVQMVTKNLLASLEIDNEKNNWPPRFLASLPQMPTLLNFSHIEHAKTMEKSLFDERPLLVCDLDQCTTQKTLEERIISFLEDSLLPSNVFVRCLLKGYWKFKASYPTVKDSSSYLDHLLELLVKAMVELHSSENSSIPSTMLLFRNVSIEIITEQDKLNSKRLLEFSKRLCEKAKTDVVFSIFLPTLLISLEHKKDSIPQLFRVVHISSDPNARKEDDSSSEIVQEADDFKNCKQENDQQENDQEDMDFKNALTADLTSKLTSILQLSNLSLEEITNQGQESLAIWSFMEDICDIRHLKELTGEASTLCARLDDLKKMNSYSSEVLISFLETLLLNSVVYLQTEKPVQVNMFPVDKEILTDECSVCIYPEMKRAFKNLWENSQVNEMMSRKQRIYDIENMLRDVESFKNEMDIKMNSLKHAKELLVKKRQNLTKEEILVFETEIHLQEQSMAFIDEKMVVMRQDILRKQLEQELGV